MIIENWKKKNGLDYNGWIGFIVRRWLRKNKLGFIVPFDWRLEFENTRHVEATIWEFGKRRVEVYHLPHYRVGEFFYECKRYGITSLKTEYRILQCLGSKQ